MFGGHLVSSTLSIYDAIGMADDDQEEGKKKCVSCGDENRRLSLLIGKKIQANTELLGHIQQFLDISNLLSLPYGSICDPCLRRIESFYVFRNSARNHVNSYLQQLKSQNCRTPIAKQKRKRVIDCLISSVEKLKQNSRSPNDNSLNELDHAYCQTQNSKSNQCSNSSDHAYASSKGKYFSERKKSRKSLFSSDHDYVCEGSLGVVRRLQYVSQPQDDYSSAIENMTVQLQLFSAPKASTLSNIHHHVLSQTSLFDAASKELQQSCTFLYDVLQAALGDQVNENMK
jgi:hypothetical protein